MASERLENSVLNPVVSLAVYKMASTSVSVDESELLPGHWRDTDGQFQI